MRSSLAPPSLELAGRLREAVARTNRVLRQESGSELTPTLAVALRTVIAHGPLTPSSLAERERVRRPTATRLIAKLEERGLVERARDPADRRSCLIAATRAGHDLLAQHRSRADESYARRLDELTAAEREIVASAAELLVRMADA